MEKHPAGDADRVTATRVADSSAPFSSASDVEGDGTTSFLLEGLPERGEEGAAEAAGYVVERLNALGASWHDVRQVPRDARAERGGRRGRQR